MGGAADLEQVELSLWAERRLDVETRSLSLLVFADWYNVDTMVKMRFFDDNTRSWWTPATGGANVPALNDLLQPFGIAFGDVILNGNFQLAKSRISCVRAPTRRSLISLGKTRSVLWASRSDD